MTYIDTDHLDSRLEPGKPVGDAKTLETRGVKIAINPQGYPAREELKVGSVVYIDGEHHAVPFTKPSVDYENGAPIPYGVVYLMDTKPRNAPLRDITPYSNEVKVAVEGVVAIKMREGEVVPHVGELVNPYGGSMNRTLAPDVPTSFTALGVCDGVQYRPGPSSEGGGTYVAVRLGPSEKTSGSAVRPVYTRCYAIQAVKRYEAVCLADNQPRAPEEGLNRVKPVSSTERESVYGFAMTATASEGPGEITVLVDGVAYFPFVFKETVAKLIDSKLIEAPSGKMPKSIAVRSKRPNGTANDWSDILFGVCSVIPAVGILVDIGLNIYHAITDDNSAGTCEGSVEKNTAEYRNLLMSSGLSDSPVEPDGYLKINVSPHVLGMAPVTRLPFVLPDERDKTGNILIREGRCYVGSYEGVRAVTPEDDVDTVSFYGVATEPLPDDEVTGVNEDRIRVVRDGMANVVATTDWTEGSYIDIHGAAIDPADEEFVPHIGRAVGGITLDSAKNEDERRGKVDIRPFSPNQYIIVDHCKAVLGPPIQKGTSVYVEQVIEDSSSTNDDPQPVKSKIMFATPTVEHAYQGVTGVIMRYEPGFYGPGEYDGRAIIQTSGFVRCKSDPDSPLSLPAGSQITYMLARIPFAIEHTDPTEPEYMNILGTLLRTDPSADGSDPHWWVMLAPRTQYVAPIEETKKV